MDLLIERVKPNENYPDGIRFRFLLIDEKEDKTRYLVDNYHDHGPHEHPIYHLEKSKRVELDVKNQSEAMNHFFNVIEGILDEEE